MHWLPNRARFYILRLQDRPHLLPIRDEFLGGHSNDRKPPLGFPLWGFQRALNPGNASYRLPKMVIHIQGGQALSQNRQM